MLQRKKERVVYRSELANCVVPLGLRSVGQAFLPPRYVTGMRKIDFVQILWTGSGEGRVHLGDKDYPVMPDWIALCLPDSGHCLSAGDALWEYRWCTVDGPYAVALIASFRIHKLPFLAGSCPFPLFARLEGALRDASPAGEKAASVEAYRFLAHIAGLASEGKGPSAERILQPLLATIAAEIGNPALNVYALAERAGMSRCTLHRKFMDALGMPPKKYLDSLRMQKMLSLLRETDQTLAEIARATGFANANYLAKFFRKKKNSSPSQFREASHMP